MDSTVQDTLRRRCILARKIGREAAQMSYVLPGEQARVGATVEIDGTNWTVQAVFPPEKE